MPQTIEQTTAISPQALEEVYIAHEAATYREQAARDLGAEAIMRQQQQEMGTDRFSRTAYERKVSRIVDQLGLVNPLLTDTNRELIEATYANHPVIEADKESRAA